MRSTVFYRINEKDIVNRRQLTQELLAAGCNALNFSIGKPQHDALCLLGKPGHWRVVYVERGQESEPLFESANEAEAYAFFKGHLLNQRHWHLVGFFELESEALALQHHLQQSGIDCFRNDIPAYHDANDPRYRVFVSGQAIFAVRQLGLALPLTHLTDLTDST